jgi:hypothetical protein
MKKVFICLLIALYGIPSIAQEAGQTRFSFVLTPQMSWMNSDNDQVSGKGSMFGYNFGIIVDSFFDDNYAFCTGFTINTTGGKLSYEGTPASLPFSQRYKLKYIEIPAGLKLRSEDMHRTNIYGRFGLSPQINIQALNDKGDNISNEVRLFQLGYHLGGGIEYSIGRRNALMFGLLFNNGFSDITKRANYEDKANLNRLVFEFGFIF